MPLPPDVNCCTIAASIGRPDADLTQRLLGDGLVALASALGQHPRPASCLAFPDDRRWIGYGMGHLDLPSRPEVYAQLVRSLAPSDVR